MGFVEAFMIAVPLWVIAWEITGCKVWLRELAEKKETKK